MCAPPAPLPRGAKLLLLRSGVPVSELFVIRFSFCVSRSLIVACGHHGGVDFTVTGVTDLLANCEILEIVHGIPFVLRQLKYVPVFVYNVKLEFEVKPCTRLKTKILGVYNECSIEG